MKRNVEIFIFALFTFLLTYSLSFGTLLFEKSEYSTRREKLMKMIPDGLAIILGAQSQVGSTKFYQSNDFIYLSGVEIPNSILVVNGVNKESILFFTISEEAARNEGIPLDIIRNPKKVTGIERVLPFEQFSSYLTEVSSQVDVFYTMFKPEELMREMSNSKLSTLRKNMIYNEWDGRLTRELQFVKHLKERFPKIEVKDCSEMIWDLRTIKSPAEVELIKKAAKIGVKAHIELIKATRVGMWEYELAALFEYYCKKEGAQDLAYNIIICSGENHPYLHYYKHDRKLKDGDFIVVDAGPDFGYYDVDITVSYPANGKFTPRQREIYEASNEIHKASMSLYRPGITLEELTERTNNILKEKGFDISKDIFTKRFMRPKFGHYVGMAVHDVGGRRAGHFVKMNPEYVGSHAGNRPLEPGMVFANEPFAVFPDENLGVRVEDTILITEDGCENLTKGIPREIDEIEALMKKKGSIQILKKEGIY